MNYLVVYSTRNNRDYETPGWMTVAETTDKEKALCVFRNFSAMAEDKEEYRAGFGAVTQAALFVDHGRDTFHRRPRYYTDCRDKTGWSIRAEVGQIGNMLNSDYSMNRIPREGGDL